MSILELYCFLKSRKVRSTWQVRSTLKYPKYVTLNLRLTEFLHSKGHIEYGDSYFVPFRLMWVGL